jgi:hypothetical protein
MEISTGELEHLVSVAKAYGVRSDARARAKDAKVEVEKAEREERHYGGFRDCGDSYRSALDEAKGVMSAAVSSEIKSEKAFKRARLTAIEQHPRLEQLIDELVYDKSKPVSKAA